MNQTYSKVERRLSGAKQDGKWTIVGRISHGAIFIGNVDETSYEEYQQTPETLQLAKRFLIALHSS